MTTIPASPVKIQTTDKVGSAVCEGLLSRPKWLPSWLFYDTAGSRLFEQITRIPEYYLTRTERAILEARATDIVARAGDGQALRVIELGAGSAEKTTLLLEAAVERQDTVFYEPVDVSAMALIEAQMRLEAQIPGVLVCPRVADYTKGLELDSTLPSERRLVLYIGSSIGNFEPDVASQLLRNVRAAVSPGDCMLLGVDLVKDESVLLSAYDDAGGVTAAFNRNILVRLNRELDADFDLQAFDHRAAWNAAESRMEMHLVSSANQTVWLPALDMRVNFVEHETHSYREQLQVPSGAGGGNAGRCWIRCRGHVDG